VLGVPVVRDDPKLQSKQNYFKRETLTRSGPHLKIFIWRRRGSCREHNRVNSYSE
jgi:hypothetical protein